MFVNTSYSSQKISRRTLKSNKRLEKEFEERTAEKDVWYWTLTSFAFEV